MNKYLKKNLIVLKEEEHLFQKSNNCWMEVQLIGIVI